MKNIIFISIACSIVMLGGCQVFNWMKHGDAGADEPKVNIIWEVNRTDGVRTLFYHRTDKNDTTLTVTNSADMIFDNSGTRASATDCNYTVSILDKNQTIQLVKVLAEQYGIGEK